MGLLLSQTILFPQEIYTTLANHLTPEDLFIFLATTKWPPLLFNADQFWSQKCRTDFGPTIHQFSSETTPPGIYREAYKASTTIKPWERLLWMHRIGHSEFVIERIKKMKCFQVHTMGTWIDAGETRKLQEADKTEMKESFPVLKQLIISSICQGDMPLLDQVLTTTASWSGLLLVLTNERRT